MDPISSAFISPVCNSISECIFTPQDSPITKNNKSTGLQQTFLQHPDPLHFQSGSCNTGFQLYYDVLQILFLLHGSQLWIKL